MIFWPALDACDLFMLVFIMHGMGRNLAGWTSYNALPDRTRQGVLHAAANKVPRDRVAPRGYARPVVCALPIYCRTEPTRFRTWFRTHGYTGYQRGYGAQS